MKPTETDAATPSSTKKFGRRYCRLLFVVPAMALYVGSRVMAASLDLTSLHRLIDVEVASFLPEEIMTQQHNKKTEPSLRPLLEHSRTFRQEQQQPPSLMNNNITAAVCLRTVFGGFNDRIMEYVLRWVAYNHLLGFDEILVWYWKNFTPPGFELLQTLPYVTLVENTRNPIRDTEWPDMLNNKHPGGQNEDIVECFNRTKDRFDWVFLSDSDEYLWFADKIRLKEFLYRHQDKKYLSFGKWMYDDRVQYSGTRENFFGLEKYPYTYKSYCRSRKGDKNCPDWYGRSKVLFRRDSFKKMQIHGLEGYINHKKPPPPGCLHFNTDVAHIKEWKFSVDGFTFLGSMNQTVRQNVVGLVTSSLGGGMNESVSNATRLVANLPGVDAFEMTADGKNTLYRDDNLQDWFDFVAGKHNRTVLDKQ